MVLKFARGIGEEVTDLGLTTNIDTSIGADLQRTDNSLIGQLVPFPELAIESEKAFAVAEIQHAIHILLDSPVLNASFIFITMVIHDLR